MCRRGCGLLWGIRCISIYNRGQSCKEGRSGKPDRLDRRDRVNPASNDWHGEGQVFPTPYGETETALQTVARGPVPRERPRAPEIVVRDRLIPKRQDQAILPYRGMSARPPHNRSAGACPPRSFDLRENRTQTQAVSPIEARRGTGPRPTVTTEQPIHGEG